VIHGNTVPVNLDVAAPDGSVTRVRQLDNYQRETRSALKTYLERAHVAFGDAKAGEPLPGSAVLFVGPSGTLGISYANTEDRLRYLTNTRHLVIPVDRGSGIEVDTILGPSTAPIINQLTVQSDLGTSFADLGAAPMQCNYDVAATSNQPRMVLRVEASIQVQNIVGSDQNCAFRFVMATDAGAYAASSGAAENTFNTAMYSAPSLTLKSSQVLLVYMVLEFQVLGTAVARQLRFRVQGRASNASSIRLNAGSIENPVTTLRISPRRANSETF
jgi:hypothetical protein